MASAMSKWGNDLYTGKRSYDIVGSGTRWIAVSLGLVLVSLALLLGRGLNPGIAFRGGSEFTVPGVSDTAHSRPWTRSPPSRAPRSRGSRWSALTLSGCRRPS